MHARIPLRLEHAFAVTASPADTLALLADVPRSASHFPGVHALVPLGDNAFRWEMNRVGVGELSLQTVYASRYHADANALRVWWEPLPGVGNAAVAGHWQLAARAGGGTRVQLVLDTQFELPIPHLLAHAAEKVLAHELDRQVRQYIAALQHTLGAAH